MCYFAGFSKLSKALAQQEQDRLNGTMTVEMSEDGIELATVDEKSTYSSRSSYLQNVMVDEEDFSEDGSIILWARDYREMGRWIPRDTSYVIGRYMYETDSLPRPWVNHCNQLDEVWVPSQWQYEAFENGGVLTDKMRIMGETVDEYFFDPYAVQPLALPGTKLDGFLPLDKSIPPQKIDTNGLKDELTGAENDLLQQSNKKRPFAFCAVFKMEDRKGYKELVEGYMKEFHNNSDVVLVLRTYIHSGQGISDENFSPYLIRQYVCCAVLYCITNVTYCVADMKRLKCAMCL